MTLSDEEFVRLRAYALWVEEGRPEGRELLHWQRARRELELNASRSERILDDHVTLQQAAETTKEQP